MIIILCQISTPLSHVEIYYFLDTVYHCKNNTSILQELNPGVTEREKPNKSPSNGWILYS